MENLVFMPHGQSFLIRRLFESQTIEDEANQRDNIFHGRCLIQGKVCLLNVDSGSCANMVSSRVVSKLNLVTRPHPTPYQLQWISEVGEIIVNKQVEIPFSIGKYEDVVLCDVVHMETSHMILGRPWQFDRRTIHDCFSNKITFLHQNRKVVLSSLSPKQAKEDQQRLREKLEEERNETLCEKQEFPKEASKSLPPMELDENVKNASNLIIQPSEPGEYVDLNSRSNSLQEGGYDSNLTGPKSKKTNKPIKLTIQLGEPPNEDNISKI
ncbi:hypothetical protein Lal_00046628 [Lupinus albus]|nr:hypothetical protein Lal_00046625 [Lupinus albus]KAF1856374.1 hypothetical protein Lal_00046628 [Lupinus albus]